MSLKRGAVYFDTHVLGKHAIIYFKDRKVHEDFYYGSDVL